MQFPDMGLLRSGSKRFKFLHNYAFLHYAFLHNSDEIFIFAKKETSYESI